MWALIWLAITSTNEMETYHIGNYADKYACVKELSKAHVLVTDKGQTIDCIWISTTK